MSRAAITTEVRVTTTAMAEVLLYGTSPLIPVACVDKTQFQAEFSQGLMPIAPKPAQQGLHPYGVANQGMGHTLTGTMTA